jgi:hypothetical protein
MLLRGVVSMAAVNGAKKIPIDIVRCALYLAAAFA